MRFRAKIKCIIAGDINIDLTKCTVSSDTNANVDNLVMNNFVPTILMPTRTTSLSATLIDHIYYYDGYNSSSNICSGNLLCDYISDHLPNYTFIFSNRETCRKSRLLCIFFLRKTWTYLVDMLVKLIGVQFIVLKMLILLTTVFTILSNLPIKMLFRQKSFKEKKQR